ncbi:MAG: TraR/DksA family transcriptional regulator [Comamonadaceae bacterium]|nr:MAG: TraR/DksA family transcriptional regulator [Comamonadaceae bacterium]
MLMVVLPFSASSRLWPVACLICVNRVGRGNRGPQLRQINAGHDRGSHNLAQPRRPSVNKYDSSMAPQFSDLLAQRLARLREVLQSDRPAGGIAEPAGQEVTDFKDAAQEEELSTVHDAESAHAAQDLAAVLAAQRRLADHSYGICAGCGAPIDVRRLHAMPQTPYCAPCQEIVESEAGAASPQRRLQ